MEVAGGEVFASDFSGFGFGGVHFEKPFVVVHEKAIVVHDGGGVCEFCAEQHLAVRRHHPPFPVGGFAKRQVMHLFLFCRRRTGTQSQ